MMEKSSVSPLKLVPFLAGTEVFTPFRRVLANLDSYNDALGSSIGRQVAPQSARASNGSLGLYPEFWTVSVVLARWHRPSCTTSPRLRNTRHWFTKPVSQALPDPSLKTCLTRMGWLKRLFDHSGSWRHTCQILACRSSNPYGRKPRAMAEPALATGCQRLIVVDGDR